MNKKIVLVTGGFDPIHSGHIAYFKTAKSLGDTLVVGINSDDWLVRKKGKAFMPLAERQEIIKNCTTTTKVLIALAQAVIHR
jgi:D-beta-D-heptose 7-phosphate kinase/D-beta-D-heptose 1-phosphate adenosyltransferase